MIAVLVWKEYRQQRMVSIAITVLAALLLLGLPFVTAPDGFAAHPGMRESLCVAAVILAYIHALVCGVLLLTGEREMGTLPFLDALPGYRQELWRGKFLAGLLLVCVQIALMMGLAAAGRLFENRAVAGLTLLGMTGAGLYGFAWGLLFSSFGRGSTNTILLALAAQVATGFALGAVAAVVSVLASIALGVRLPGEDPGPYLSGLAFLTVPAALVGSALVFTRLDRARTASAPPSMSAPSRPGKVRVAWSMLFWLTWRQAQGFAAGLAAFSLLLGLVVLGNAVIAWPAATLLIGVLCGATAFADEQQGPSRFLGDQRLPLGRLWLVKVGVRFGIAVLAAVIVFLPSFLVGVNTLPVTPQRDFHVFGHIFRSGLLATLVPPGLFLTMWLVHGFAAGCLCGLLLRNGLAAGVFGLFLGALTTAVWIPSLLEGGLQAWQVVGAPLLLLLSTRLILRPWAANRIASLQTALRIVPFAALAVLWIMGGLWYRVLEIPSVTPAYDLDAFRAGLPTPEQNESGRLIHAACQRFDEVNRRVLIEEEAAQAAAHPVAPGMPPVPGGMPAVPGMPGGAVGAMPAAPGGPPVPDAKPPLYMRIDDVLNHVLNDGWPNNEPELPAWLDKMVADDWVRLLTEAADKPPGMVLDLSTATIASQPNLWGALFHSGVMAELLAVRGLQRQAAGDDGAFVENLRIGLYLSHALRHNAVAQQAHKGWEVESVFLRGLDRWLEKLNGRPELLRKVLALFSDYLAETAQDDAYQHLANHLVARNSLDDQFPWLVDFLNEKGNFYGRGDARVREEARWVTTAALFPWEHERQSRLLRFLFERPDAARQNRLVEESPLQMMTVLARHSSVPTWTSCREGAMQLKLALRLYEAENGKPAEKLDELVPKYLPALPPDPYDGKPFRYRLSRGEEIDLPEEPAPPGATAPGLAPVNPPPPPAMKVLPGQGVLWCVGSDGSDDGGHRQARSPQEKTWPGEDVIFLVPLPAKER